jgi:glc operon protein GlcG
MPEKPSLSFTQVQAAMQAMINQAMQTPAEPVAMAIVDGTGNLLAYASMDNLRLYSRRHALRKAYTAAIMGLDTGAHAQRLHGQGRSISELGDAQLTFGQGGLVIMQGGVLLGGIGVGGYSTGQRDEELARVGLNAMRL